MTTTEIDREYPPGVHNNKALSELVAAGVFFIFDTEDVFWTKDDEETGTIQLSLNCNDLWLWACADQCPVTVDELPDLYYRFKADEKWGATKFACVKRSLCPQVPIVKKMKDSGSWDSEMESLPKPVVS